MLQLALLGLGGLFILVSIMMALETHRLFSKGIRAQGKIVAFETERKVSTSSSRPGWTTESTPVYEFEDQKGKTWQVKGSIGGKGNVGTAVALVYDPEDPTAAIEATYAQYLFALGMLVGGGICVALGVFIESGA